MKEHISKVKNHEFGEILTNSLEIVQEIVDDEQEFGEVGMSVITRAHHVLTHLITIYKNTDPLMVNPQRLTDFVGKNINPKIASLSVLLNKYKESQDINDLEKVNNILNRFITFSSYFIYPKTGREMAGLRGATEKYYEVVNEYTSNVQEKMEIFERTSAELAVTVENEVESRKEKISTFEKSLLEEQNTVKNLFDSRVEEIEIEYNEKFSKAEDEKKNFIERISEELEDLKENYQKTINEHIEGVQGIVGALAERSISYGFQQIANEEKESKEKWNKITLMSFVALICYTIGMAIASFFYEFTWSTMILRGLTGIAAFGALIGFCSRQANIHAKVERHSRKMELELASLSPYFAGYEKDELFEIKKELADRFFGTDDVVTQAKGNNQKNEKRLEEILGILKDKRK